MRKPTEKELYSIEFSDPTQEILKSAFASANPAEALKQLVRCLKGKVILRCEAIEYSRSTGKPIRYGWKPNESWDGRLWLDSFGNSPSLDKNDPLYKPLLNFLPVGKTTIVEVGNEKFVVRHVPSRSEGDWQSGGTVPNHIEFTTAS